MSKFKVGDKVRVKVFDKRPSHWHSAGHMDCWMGKVVTIRSIGTYDTKIIEDEDAFHENVAAGWNWKESDFETIPAREFIVIRRSGAETIAELRHDREVIKSAKATCAPTDAFDLDTGAKLAFDRLMGRQNINEAIKAWNEPSPAPEPPKFYTGKVFAVSVSDNCPMYNRVNCVFEIVNGSAGERGKAYGIGEAPFLSFKHLCERLYGNEWREVKE